MRQIIDGGYYENYGIETALEIIELIEDPALRLDFVPVPFLLTISNDVAGRPTCALPDEPARSVTAAMFGDLEVFSDVTLSCENLDFYPEPRTTGGPASEGLAPLSGLLGARSAHGLESLSEARSRLCLRSDRPAPAVQAGLAPVETDRFFHVALPSPVSREHAAPMNWVLDHRVRRFFVEAVNEPANQRQLRAMAGAMHAVMGRQTQRTAFALNFTKPPECFE